MNVTDDGFCRISNEEMELNATQDGELLSISEWSGITLRS